MKKSEMALGKILNFILIIITLLLISIGSYFLYLNIPREAKNLNVEIEPIKELEPLNIEIKQFYPNMKFNHNKLSYIIEDNCEANKKQRVIMAFEELSKKVNIISFYPATNNPDIEITCSKKNIVTGEESEQEKHFIAGEGGARKIIKTGAFNIIIEGTILLYDNNLKTIECSYPNVELHELMHVFGFDHVDNKRSLMYQYIESCDQILDLYIIEQLNQLYSQPNLPDLYFENISAIKKGRYLDFNLTVRNSGSIDSGNVILTILDNDEVVEETNLEALKFGSGISLQTQNIRLIRLNPEKISFIIDKENKIKEINEKNNIAIVEAD